MTALKERSIEVINDLHNGIAQLRQAWDNRLEIGRTDIRKRYLAGRLNVHLHLFRSNLGHDLCIVFQSNTPSLKKHSDRPLDEFAAMYCGGGSANRCDGGGDNQGVSMLIGVVELRKQRKRMIVRGSGVTRLQPLDCCLSGSGNTLYHSIESGFVFVRDGICIDRPSTTAKTRPVALFKNDELTYEVVEERSQLMDGLANDYGEFSVDRTTGNRGEKVPMGFAVAVELMPDFAVAHFSEGIDKSGDLYDVLIGPFNLLADTYDASGHCPTG